MLVLLTILSFSSEAYYTYYTYPTYYALVERGVVWDCSLGRTSVAQGKRYLL